jgi:O-antigen ligase
MNTLLSLLLIGLVIFITFRYTVRKIHNGILFMMIAGMSTFYMTHLGDSGDTGVSKLPTITADRVIVVCVLIIFVIKWWRNETEKFSFNWIEVCMLLLVVAIFISMWSNKSYQRDVNGEGKVALGTLLTGFIYPYIAYFIARRGVRDRSQFQSFLIGVGCIVLYLGIDSLAELFHQDWLVFPKYILDPEQGVDFGKVRGPMLNSSYNGLALSMGLFTYIWLIFSKRDRTRWLWCLGAVIAGVGVLSSFQRAVWLGAIVGFLVVVVTWPRHRSYLTGTLVAAAAVGCLVVPDSFVANMGERLKDKESLQFRLQVIQKAQAAFASSPIVGVGFNAFNGLDTDEHEGLHSHNTPIVLAAEVGLLGILPYVSIFVLFAWDSIRAYFQSPDSRTVTIFLWAITAGYLVMALSIELRAIAYLNVLFFGLWGMFSAAARPQPGFALS